MKIPPLLKYSVLRLLAFLVPLAVLWLFPIMRQYWWLTVIFAALIGMSISMLLLRRPLSEASTEIYNKREGRVSGAEADAEAEDAEGSSDSDATAASEDN